MCLCRQISDPGNAFMILDSFSFPSDKQRAQQILAQVSDNLQTDLQTDQNARSIAAVGKIE